MLTEFAYEAVAAQLRHIADDLAAIPTDDLGDLSIQLNIQTGVRCDDDEQLKVRTLDTVAVALLGRPAAPEQMHNGSWHHTVHGSRGVDGERATSVEIGIYSSVTNPAERIRRAELAQLRADLEAATAKLAGLEAASA